MRRSVALLAVLLLFAPAFTLGAARAEDPLQVDAGDSRSVGAGQTIALAGLAKGGVAPYAFAWSWDGGDASRFADASAQSTTFSTTGLGAQDFVVTLTVTDAMGAVAADTVRHRISSSPTLLDRRFSFNAGTPEEIVAPSADVRTFQFTVAEGTTRITATLDWTEPVGGVYDLDLELFTPDGTSATGGQGQTQANPEVAVVDAPASGIWRARIYPFLTGPTDAHLVIRAAGGAGGSIAQALAHGPVAFGTRDTQKVHSSAPAGTAPFTYAWDVDDDGFFETPGQDVLLNYDVGVHPLAVRVTDALGFEDSDTTTIDVRDTDSVLRMRCGTPSDDEYRAMEFSASKGTCWIHGGHHTYFTGHKSYALGAFTGFLVSVEQQFSPPTDVNGTTTPVHIETSLDGIVWTEVHRVSYAFAGASTRQELAFAGDGAGQPFRFLRVHQPLSAAQGLSGYLDHTHLDVETDVLGSVSPNVTPGEADLDCATDVMEDFFEAHPCWYGGIDRWDAPSIFHTYFVGDGAKLDRISGRFTLAPFRHDDWSEGDEANATRTLAYLQVSADGVNWLDVATIPATYGGSTAFDITLDHLAAPFVRLFPEYHASFDDFNANAPLHHPKGYFLDSGVHVEGLLPA